MNYCSEGITTWQLLATFEGHGIKAHFVDETIALVLFIFKIFPPTLYWCNIIVHLCIVELDIFEILVNLYGNARCISLLQNGFKFLYLVC